MIPAATELRCALGHVDGVFSKRATNELGMCHNWDRVTARCGVFVMQTEGSKLMVPLPELIFHFPKNREFSQTYQLARPFTNHRSGAQGHWSVVKVVAGTDLFRSAKSSVILGNGVQLEWQKAICVRRSAKASPTASPTASPSPRIRLIRNAS